MMYSFFGSLWGRMASCAPIANRRKLAGLPRKQDDSGSLETAMLDGTGR